MDTSKLTEAGRKALATLKRIQARWGDGMTAQELSSFSGLSLGAVYEALDELRDAGFVRCEDVEDDDGLRWVVEPVVVDVPLEPYPGDVVTATYRLVYDAERDGKRMQALQHVFTGMSYTVKPRAFESVAVALGAVVRWVPVKRLERVPGELRRLTAQVVVMTEEPLIL